MTNSMICDISNSKKDEVTLQFVSSAAERIQVGNYARALLTGSLNYVDGIVSFVGDRITTLSSGATVIDVTVQVTDSKYALSGVYASAEITTSTGTFKDKDFVATCEDIYLMDIGESAFTSFKESPDVANYMCNHPDLLKEGIHYGLIH